MKHTDLIVAKYHADALADALNVAYCTVATDREYHIKNAFDAFNKLVDAMGVIRDADGEVSK